MDIDSGRILYQKEVSSVNYKNNDYIMINSKYIRNINNICTSKYTVLYNATLYIVC